MKQNRFSIFSKVIVLDNSIATPPKYRRPCPLVGLQTRLSKVRHFLALNLTFIKRTIEIRCAHLPSELRVHDNHGIIDV
jgi:hypothetical protein